MSRRWIVSGLAAILAVSLASSGAFAEGFISQADYDKAAKAALDATGGGRVLDVDIDRERGAMYEVEVITTDGRSVDVLLDSNFKVIDTSGESDSGEPSKPGGHGRDDDDDDLDLI